MEKCSIIDRLQEGTGGGEGVGGDIGREAIDLISFANSLEEEMRWECKVHPSFRDNDALYNGWH
eukprot:199162-Rhodomonas_salina.3